MIKIENFEVVGWEHAIRGMRNPMNSWAKSDTVYFSGGAIDLPYNAKGQMCDPVKDSIMFGDIAIGPNDHDLMMRLKNAGTDHRKFMRYLDVYVDITAPLYWWKEFKTYRRGRQFMDDDEDILEPYIETNSCSTMHKIHEKEFTIEDFSHEQLINNDSFCWENDLMTGPESRNTPLDILSITIDALNTYREKFIQTKDKRYWWQIIQLLPSSYNQLRTVKLNYEVLTRMYHSRKNHKLDEWVEFCKWIESLPYSEIITCIAKEGE